MKKLGKILGLSIAALGLTAWLGASNVEAKPAYATATGKKCVDCHVGAPKDKKLTDTGKTFEKCLKAKKDAAKCK
jgi:hypothetical protein